MTETSPSHIIHLQKQACLLGKRVLISVGPMRTEIDPVRFIQNRSSGKMGLALAQACVKSGAASVTVVLGPVSDVIRDAFSSCSVRMYDGPAEYESHLDQCFPVCDVFFSAAAVLDFEVISQDKKIERSQLSQSSKLELQIKPVPDIVAKFAQIKKTHQKVIAFAAESGTESEILERAERKMLKKSVDAMIANPVWPGLGPDSDENLVWLLQPGRSPVKLGPLPKYELAGSILEHLFKS